MTGRLEDMYPSLDVFEGILDDALMAAGSDNEENFVKETKKKYDTYGGRIFWSKKQDDWLRRISGEDL